MTIKIFKQTFLLVALGLLLLNSSCHHETEPTPSISCDEVVNSTTWTDRGDSVDYTINCVITVSAALIIEPGVTIQFGPGAGIIVETSGSLRAIGTAAKPIVLKSESNTAGVWKGIYFKSNNVLNELNYCTVSNAGSGSFDGNATKVANIRVAVTAQFKISNSTVSMSGKDGLLIDGLDSDDLNPLTQFGSNTFTNNLNYPISAIGTIGKVLDGTGSTYTGNTHNKVLLRGGRLFGNNTWKKMSVSYLIQDLLSVGYYTNDGNLTIEPGTTVQFTADAGLCTGDYGIGSWLSIVGTSSDRIYMTAETSSPGSWKGIAFQSTDARNKISYADVSYAGSSSFTGNTSQKGNIHAGAWSAGSFTIDNANVMSSAGYGIYATAASPVVTIPGSVYFAGNASGTYHHE